MIWQQYSPAAKEDVSWDGNVFTLTFSDGFKVTCDKLINAAGLHAGQLAETFVEPRLLPKLLVQKSKSSGLNLFSIETLSISSPILAPSDINSSLALRRSRRHPQH